MWRNLNLKKEYLVNNIWRIEVRRLFTCRTTDSPFRKKPVILILKTWIIHWLKDTYIKVEIRWSYLHLLPLVSISDYMGLTMQVPPPLSALSPKHHTALPNLTSLLKYHLHMVIKKKMAKWFTICSILTRGDARWWAGGAMPPLPCWGRLDPCQGNDLILSGKLNG